MGRLEFKREKKISFFLFFFLFDRTTDKLNELICVQTIEREKEIEKKKEKPRRPHRSREILFDLFMLIESAND